MPKNYWMVVTSPEEYRFTRSHGFKVQALKSQHQRKVQRIEPGDRILYYIGGKRYFAATATATSRYFEDRSSQRRKDGAGGPPLKIRIHPEIVLDEKDFMDACQIAPRLDYVRRWTPEDWYIAFAQTNLHLLPKKDFILLEAEMHKVKSRSSRHRRNGPAPPAPINGGAAATLEPSSPGLDAVAGDGMGSEHPEVSVD